MQSERAKVISSIRELPSVDFMVQHYLAGRHGQRDVPARPMLAALAREFLQSVRERFSTISSKALEIDITGEFEAFVSENRSRDLQRVINATGILIHTNLGRAPLPEKVVEAVSSMLTGYSNLEYDLINGARGNRGSHLESLLATLCETESSTVTNNCAAALVLMVNTFAQKREIIISRSELVQIGGGFRIPEILTRAGAKIREVGTTNITTEADYESAISDKTALILKVHQSNFVQRGFESSVGLTELGKIATVRGIPLVYDLGSGLLDHRLHSTLCEEPTAFSAVRSGVDLVCFSGDKLFGAHQAGILAGRGSMIAKIKRNPLFRAFRLDKFSIAILTEVTKRYLEKRESEIPVWQMLAIRESDLYTRARSLIASLGEMKAISVESCHSQLGGGSMPEKNIPSVALCIRGRKVNQLAAALRKQTPPIISRIQDESVMLDLRTVHPSDDQHLVSSLRQILSS